MNTLSQILGLSLLTSLIAPAQAQEVSIPDPNLNAAITIGLGPSISLTAIPKSNDGEILVPRHRWAQSSAVAQPQAQIIQTSFGCYSTAPEGNPESFTPVCS